MEAKERNWKEKQNKASQMKAAILQRCAQADSIPTYYNPLEGFFSYFLTPTRPSFFKKRNSL